MSKSTKRGNKSTNSTTSPKSLITNYTRP